jgi:hypothetical protein
MAMIFSLSVDSDSAIHFQALPDLDITVRWERSSSTAHSTHSQPVPTALEAS